MARYKIVVSYDGTDYFGWQRLKDQPSICAMLEERFKLVFNRTISILGASRTDAGVHALGQVACFDTDLKLEPERMLEAWNRLLPESIKILSLEKKWANYNCHAHVAFKVYEYVFFQKRPSPFHARYGWHYYSQVDVNKLKQCLQVFVGTHDFRSFCTGYDRPDTVRSIDNARVEYDTTIDGYRIIIEGQSFLRHMIRRIVGACLHVASRDTLTVKDLEVALAEKTPAQTLPNAPAKGLTLVTIHYIE